MHDDTGPSKFTTKRRLREIIPTSYACTQFSHGYSFYLCCFGNSFILIERARPQCASSIWNHKYDFRSCKIARHEIQLPLYYIHFEIIQV